MKKILVLGAAVVVIAASKSAVKPINSDSMGVALKGYDVVAYFTEGKVVKGSPQFTFDWTGARWQFASMAHRDAFAAEPSKYAPQYGGYCAWAVGHGNTADTDPEAWRIVNGKLYLNYNKSIQQKWDPDRLNWISEADRNWPGLHQ